MAWLQSSPQGKFLCTGEHKFARLLLRKGRHVTPPIKHTLPLDYVGPGRLGWQPRSWRLEISRQEDSQRMLDKDRRRLTEAKDRQSMAQYVREQLPQLTLRDIRRHRIPLVQSLPLDLEEDGYPMTASIIEGFIHYNNQMREVAPRGSPFSTEPPISHRPDLLLRLAASLSEVEAAGQHDPPRRAEQIERLLSLAVELRSGGETLFWVVEKMLLIACDIASAHSLDGYRSEALARYAYGHFLDDIGQLEPAIDQLERARCLALSKEWTMDLKMPHPHKLLVLDVVELQSRVLLKLAREERFVNPKRSVRLCSRALRRLGDPALVSTEAEVLLELGLAYKEDENFPMARTALAMYLEDFGKAVPPEGLCVALLEVARCHSQLGEIRAAQENLLKVLELAKKSGLKELTALSLQCMGEGFLTIKYFRTASDCLGKSFELYQELEMQGQMDVLRVLAAVSKGHEILPYMSALMYSILESHSDESMAKLLLWRLHRYPFWRMDEPGKVPQLPNPRVYTRVLLPPEDVEDEEQRIIEKAMTMREDALAMARDEVVSRIAARRLQRAERLKEGARVQVLHPDFVFQTHAMQLSSLLVEEAKDSLTSTVNLKRIRMKGVDEHESLSRLTQNLLTGVTKGPSDEQDEKSETGSLRKRGLAKEKSDSIKSSKDFFHPTPTRRTDSSHVYGRTYQEDNDKKSGDFSNRASASFKIGPGDVTNIAYDRGEATQEDESASPGSTPSRFNRSILSSDLGENSDILKVSSSIATPMGSILAGGTSKMIFEGNRDSDSSVLPSSPIRESHSSAGAHGDSSSSHLSDRIYPKETEGVTNIGPEVVPRTDGSINRSISPILESSESAISVRDGSNATPGEGLSTISARSNNTQIPGKRPTTPMLNRDVMTTIPEENPTLPPKEITSPDPSTSRYESTRRSSSDRNSPSSDEHSPASGKQTAGPRSLRFSGSLDTVRNSSTARAADHSPSSLRDSYSSSPRTDEYSTTHSDGYASSPRSEGFTSSPHSGKYPSSHHSSEMSGRRATRINMQSPMNRNYHQSSILSSHAPGKFSRSGKTILSPSSTSGRSQSPFASGDFSELSKSLGSRIHSSSTGRKYFPSASSRGQAVASPLSSIAANSSPRSMTQSPAPGSQSRPI